MTMTPRARGYTLLEMVVSVAIFSIIMLFVTSAYLTMISLDKQARATNELTANLSFAIESMARTIRTGTQYGCSGGDGTCSRFSFTDSQGVAISYLVRTDGTLGQCTGSVCSASVAVPLTDPRITITSLSFQVVGSTRGDTTQPRVLISVVGTVPTDHGRTAEFVIETSATQRLIDL